MKKNNLGFTLIELLGVIVVLAVIALITIPFVLNIISNASDESIKRSIEGYAQAAENGLSEWQMLNPGRPYSTYDFSNIKTKGSKVDCTYKHSYNDGDITLGCCSTKNSKDKGKYYQYSNGIVSEVKSCTDISKSYEELQSVTFKNKNYYVIDGGSSSSDTITLFGPSLISLDTYATDIKDADNNPVQITGNTVPYYTSSTCNSSAANIQCDVSYNNSIVKQIVDAWASDNFGNELIEARIINQSDLDKYGYTKNDAWLETDNAEASSILSRNAWTSVAADGVNGNIVYASSTSNNKLYGQYTYSRFGIIPVIKISKSAL